MISIAALTAARIAAGLDFDLAEVPGGQFEIYFSELAPHCPSRLSAEAGRDFDRQQNALRIEIVPARLDRCSQKSPDGRGLAWLMSGGSPLAYGACVCAGCPRIKGDKR